MIATAKLIGLLLPREMWSANRRSMCSFVCMSSRGCPWLPEVRLTAYLLRKNFPTLDTSSIKLASSSRRTSSTATASLKCSINSDLLHVGRSLNANEFSLTPESLPRQNSECVRACATSCSNRLRPSRSMCGAGLLAPSFSRYACLLNLIVSRKPIDVAPLYLECLVQAAHGEDRIHRAFNVPQRGWNSRSFQTDAARDFAEHCGRITPASRYMVRTSPPA